MDYPEAVRVLIQHLFDRNINYSNNNIETKNDHVVQQLYFGTIYIDTPVDECVQRNQRRQGQYTDTNINNSNSEETAVWLHVTEEAIHKMHQRMEVLPRVCQNHPQFHHQPTNTPPVTSWDSAVLLISTVSTPSIEDQVGIIQQWIHNSTIIHTSSTLYHDNYCRHLYRIPNDPPMSDDADDEQTSKEQLRSSSTPNDRHLADVFWRSCVSVVAHQLSSPSSSSKIQIANQVRKHCIQQLQQTSQHCNRENTNEATKKIIWWNMFVQGNVSSSTLSLSNISTSSSTWLTREEQQILYRYTFSENRSNDDIDP